MKRTKPLTAADRLATVDELVNRVEHTASEWAAAYAADTAVRCDPSHTESEWITARDATSAAHKRHEIALAALRDAVAKIEGGLL